MIEYTHDQTGIRWKLSLRAARLAPSDGSTSPLPQPFGEIQLEQVSADKLGIQGRHPLQVIYPHLEVRHYLLVVEEGHLVQRGDVRGLALYADYNGSGLSASLTSENGRNPLAPWKWQGQPGSLTDAATQPKIEFREIAESGEEPFTWCSAAVHGWAGWNNEHKGKDWRDGIPESGATMYDPERGRVLQSIFVPSEMRGFGVAEQTMQAGEVRDTYSVLLYFPKDPTAAQKLQGIHRSMRYDGSRYGETQNKMDVERSGVISTSKCILGDQRQEQVQPEFKMAAGGRIRQHIIEMPFSPSFWGKPAALIVCLPVSKETAARLNDRTLGGRRQVI